MSQEAETKLPNMRTGLDCFQTAWGLGDLTKQYWEYVLPSGYVKKAIENHNFFVGKYQLFRLGHFQ